MNSATIKHLLELYGLKIGVSSAYWSKREQDCRSFEGMANFEYEERYVVSEQRCQTRAGKEGAPEGTVVLTNRAVLLLASI